jgi:hypothetical protein
MQLTNQTWLEPDSCVKNTHRNKKQAYYCHEIFERIHLLKNEL